MGWGHEYTDPRYILKSPRSPPRCAQLMSHRQLDALKRLIHAAARPRLARGADWAKRNKLGFKREHEAKVLSSTRHGEQTVAPGMGAATAALHRRTRIAPAHGARPVANCRCCSCRSPCSKRWNARPTSVSREHPTVIDGPRPKKCAGSRCFRRALQGVERAAHALWPGRQPARRHGRLG